MYYIRHGDPNCFNTEHEQIKRIVLFCHNGIGLYF